MRDLLGKTYVVTGATAGIGKATAAALVGRGATVAIVARSASKLSAVEAEFGREDPDADVRTYQADLSVMSDVRTAAEEIAAALGTVDVLINNVGAVFPHRSTTDAGLERTFALNHLGHAALTFGLLDSLREAEAPRVVEVSSQVHADHLDVENLQGQRSYTGLDAYRRSKLLNILFTKALHARHGDWLFTAALHPGVVNTGLLTDYDAATAIEAQQAQAARDAERPKLTRLLTRAVRGLRGDTSSHTIGVTPREGAETTLHVAADPEILGSRGAYWRESAIAEPCDIACDAALADRIWALSLEMTSK